MVRPAFSAFLNRDISATDRVFFHCAVHSGGRKLHLAFGINEKCPETTIRSPVLRPLLISTLSPNRQPVSTRRGSKTPFPRSTKTVFLRPASRIAPAGTVTEGAKATGSSTSTNVGPESVTGVIRFKAGLQGPRGGIKSPQNRTHRCRKGLLLLRERDLHGFAGLEVLCFVSNRSAKIQTCLRSAIR